MKEISFRTNGGQTINLCFNALAEFVGEQCEDEFRTFYEFVSWSKKADHSDVPWSEKNACVNHVFYPKLLRLHAFNGFVELGTQNATIGRCGERSNWAKLRHPEIFKKVCNKRVKLSHEAKDQGQSTLGEYVMKVRDVFRCRSFLVVSHKILHAHGKGNRLKPKATYPNSVVCFPDKGSKLKAAAVAFQWGIAGDMLAGAHRSLGSGQAWIQR